MLYPKIKKRKRKKYTFKMFLQDIIDNLRIIIYKTIKVFIDKDYFILFMKKSFHI